MEQSAFEAIMIGVNVFVFVAALSAGILLMSNVLDMVNFANDQAIVGMNGSLAESVGVVTERIYTGAQLLNYYRDEVELEKFEEAGNSLTVTSNYIFTVKTSASGHERTLKNFIQSSDSVTHLNNNFILEYKGMQGEQYAYVFSLIQE